jgi:hypothetical protein
MDSAKQLKDLSKVYMEAVYGGGKKEEKKDTRLVVTAADKKANTKAYQNYKAGNKAYKAADHLGEGKKADKDYDGDGKIESGKDEYFGSKDKAIKKAMGKELKDLQKAANTGKGKYVAKADKIKDVGESVEADEYIETVQQIKKAETEDDIKRWEQLTASGKFTAEEIESLKEAERDLGDRLHRKRKLYDKTTKKAMDYARREGEAAGHARYRMGSLDREMDGIRAKMKEKEKK